MSFRLKLILSVSVLIALAFGIGGTVLISASFQNSLEAETDRALHTYDAVRNTLYLLNSLGEQTDYQGLNRSLSQMNIQWQSLALYSGDDEIFSSGSEALQGYFFENISENRCTYMRISDKFGNGLVAQSLMQAGEDQLILVARFDLSHIYGARKDYQKLYITVYIGMVFVGVLTAFVFAFATTRKLNKLTAAVRRISGGDLSKRSYLRSYDEFGQLSRDFDAMADKLQENIQQLEEQMQRQESFMGAFAHELKTPMTSILGYADLLRQGGLDDNTRMQAANYIFSEGQRLEKLSFKLLELLLLHNDKLEMKPVNLAAFLQHIERALGYALKRKNVRLVFRAERTRVWIEPDLVKSLLYNLIDNASKSFDNGGIIAVTASAIQGGCQFIVADNGRGMEAGELSKITEAFYRVDKSRSRQQGGAGLGLALCKRITQLHHGDMKFASVPGTGTRVTVTLYGEGNKCDA